MLAQGGTWNGREIVPASVVALLSEPLSQQDDSVLCTPIAFAAGVMQDPIHQDPEQPPGKMRQHFGPSLKAFGHPGAGGCLAFADPENAISFAYVMNQMEVGALPGAKSIGLIERFYQA
jgi:CubicO group peptidase (beta-lactamase class C family)